MRNFVLGLAPRLSALAALLLTPLFLGKATAELKVTAYTQVVVSTDVVAKTYIWRVLTPRGPINPGSENTIVFQAEPGSTYGVLMVGIKADGTHVIEEKQVTIGGPGPVVPPPVIPPPVVPPPDNPPIPDPSPKVSQVTYVYEKDNNNPPRAVSLALQRLNTERSVLASEFEDDTLNAAGQVPAQYRIALAAAREAGMPALIVQSGSTVVRVVKAPTTETQVMEASK